MVMSDDGGLWAMPRAVADKIMHSVVQSVEVSLAYRIQVSDSCCVGPGAMRVARSANQYGCTSRHLVFVHWTQDPWGGHRSRSRS